MAYQPIKPEKIRAKEPSERQRLAVKYYLEDPTHKGRALQRAGYSANIQKKPNKVFDSETVRALLESSGIHPEHAFNRLKRHMYARKAEMLVFPPYNEEKAKEDEIEMERTGEDLTTKIKGEKLTDDDIREFIAGQNGSVFKIIHSDTARHVYFYTDDTRASLEATEKIINLFGLYAPKRSEVKGDVNVSFSLSGLRKMVEDNNIEIIKHERIIDV